VAKRAKSRAERLTVAVEAARASLSEIQTILDELTQWKDNLEGTNLENSPTHTKLEDNVDELEGYLDEIEDALQNIANIELAQGFGRD